MLKFYGEDKLQPFVNFCLHYIADLKIPKKRLVHAIVSSRCCHRLISLPICLWVCAGVPSLNGEAA